jgi:hypothetical protein
MPPRDRTKSTLEGEANRAAHHCDRWKRNSHRGQTCSASPGWPTNGEDVEAPDRMIAELKKANAGADIFTFWQRLPHSGAEAQLLFRTR